MRIEMIKRLMQIQEEKLDLLWDLNKKITKLFVKHIDIIPQEVKEDYIDITKPFIKKYTELMGREDTNEEE